MSYIYIYQLIFQPPHSVHGSNLKLPPFPPRTYAVMPVLQAARRFSARAARCPGARKLKRILRNRW